MLLKSWMTLDELKWTDENFEQSFEKFMLKTSLQEKRIMDNIQYYHESNDSTQRAAEPEERSSGAVLDVNYNKDSKPYPKVEMDGLTGTITGDDIDRVRAEATTF